MPPQNPPSPLPPPPDCSSHPKHTVSLPTPEQAAHLPPSSLLCTLPAPLPPNKGSPANMHVLLSAGRKGGTPHKSLVASTSTCHVHWRAGLSLSFTQLYLEHATTSLHLARKYHFSLWLPTALQLHASESLIPPCSVLLPRVLPSSSVANSIKLPARNDPKNMAYLNVQAAKWTTFAGGTANDRNQLYCGWPWIRSGERTCEKQYPSLLKTAWHSVISSTADHMHFLALNK